MSTILDHIQRHSVTTHLGRVNYYHSPKPESAASPSPLIFIHGFGGGSSSYEWAQVYPAFTATHGVYAPDLIGWGDSQHPDHGYRIKDYLDHLDELLDHFSPGQPAIVIASSLTAAFLVRVAIAHPQKFRALILSCPSGLSDFEADYARTLLAQIASQPGIDQWFYQLGIANSFGVRRFMEQQQFAQPERITPAMVQAYTRVAQLDGAAIAALAFVRGDLCFDLSHYLPDLTTPTFLVWGEKAQLSPVAIAHRLVRLNPQAIQSLQVLPDVGLTPQLECPAVMIGLIRKYLQKISTDLSNP
ncbi:alpha/beta hydrolase [Candidatus Synechococcus calcipolaris G9]|uniref:Alpha/beta hydrolase n=1 Tax=Candidatus Synechococcus calcipolaris G9 TaxID=1497997 RepID=A0ABT6EX40_9SYNE|nr:alpha/beta hydrolase [Candidatus Synechococcus calcipolaris]MDG2990369.1 alpha/beta hydrolase [Candidatus Synechococcus calcipolaris G9]